MIFIATQFSFNVAIGGFSVKADITAGIMDAQIVGLDDTVFSQASQFARFEETKLGQMGVFV